MQRVGSDLMGRAQNIMILVIVGAALVGAICGRVVRAEIPAVLRGYYIGVPYAAPPARWNYACIDDQGFLQSSKIPCHAH